MYPRNFLEARGIFQFEALNYQSQYQLKSGVENILKNTLFSNNTYAYTDVTTNQIVNKYYSDTFIDAASYSGVSPYHLASRVKQEVVTGVNSVSNSVTGTVSGYEGIYNFFNIGASDSQTGGAIINGLNFAKSDTTYMRPWKSPYAAILGGAQYIGEKYINRTDPKNQTPTQTIGQYNTGQQNTLYLQKFNVTPYNTYTHQYMTNVEAVNAEATKVYTAYADNLQTSIVFIIPVYNDMPTAVSTMPSGGLNPNNYLKSLTVGGQTFIIEGNEASILNGASSTMPFTMTVTNDVTAVDVMATTVNNKATVVGTGTSLLNVGENILSVQVTAENGDVKTYTISVTRN